MFKFLYALPNTDVAYVGWTQVGKEDAGAKKAPRKCKLQVMLQVPQDDVKSGALLFRMKKRWDL